MSKILQMLKKCPDKRSGNNLQRLYTEMKNINIEVSQSVLQMRELPSRSQIAGAVFDCPVIFEYMSEEQYHQFAGIVEQVRARMADDMHRQKVPNHHAKLREIMLRLA